MEPVLAEFREFLSHQTLGEPQIPLLSNITGTWMSANEATNPATWAQQIRATVRFADELGAILADPHRVLVELGPGGTLTASAIRHPKWSPGHRAVRLMRHQAQNRADRDAFLLALGQLWAAGVEVDWSPLSDGHEPRRITLPGYPFARQRHWVEPNRENHDVPAAGRDERRVGSLLEWQGRPCGGKRGFDHRSDAAANLRAVSRPSTRSTPTPISLSWAVIRWSPSVLPRVRPARASTSRRRICTRIQSVKALAAAVTARYVAGGLASCPAEPANPTAPPNIAYLLEGGLRDPAQWRVPLILRLAPDVTETMCGQC